MKVAIIYLASGNSRRFGENKLLKNIETKPMYRYGLEKLINLCKDHANWEIIVVTQHEEIRDQLKKDPVKIAFCKESKYGISYSIKAGIKEVGDAEYYAFFVADQPKMKEETIEGFLSFMENGSYELGCVKSKDQLGNPVWFDQKYKQELLSLTGDGGGKKVLKNHMEKSRFFKVLQESELCDIDYPKEMQAMLAKQDKSS